MTVTDRVDGKTIAAALQSPPTRSAPIDPSLRDGLLELFGYAIDDLHLNIPSHW